jgi:serine/threonine protein phosphatase PrpC
VTALAPAPNHIKCCTGAIKAGAGAPDPRAMRARCAARSDTGRKRTANEDFFAVEEKLGLFVVADGLGGHVAGRRASELGVAALVETVMAYRTLPPAVALRRGFAHANALIRETSEQNAQLRGMGTTLAALWLCGDEASLAHAGDSRIYLLRERRLHPLSLDHSLVGERVARGEITAEEARVHPSRHVITRAVGVLPAVEPDVSSLRVRAGDVLLLCSDGISAQLADDELEHCLSGRRDLDAAAERLIELANARGGEDNATVILVGLDD